MKPQVSTKELIKRMRENNPEYMDYEMVDVLGIFTYTLHQLTLEGKEVYLDGLGKFYIKETKPTRRKYINTTEIVDAPASYRLAISPQQRRALELNKALREHYAKTETKK